MITPNGQLPEPTQQTAPQQAVRAPQQTAPQPQQISPQAANAIHDSMIGKAFKVLSGQNTQYTVNPQTGRMQTTQVQNTPGQLFKNIVASALIGGAAGADGARENAGSPLAGVVRGGTAVINRNRQLDQERVQRAQQDYQNELRANQEQREQQQFQSEQTLLKAQTATNNLKRLQLQHDLRNASYQEHEQQVDAAKGELSAYKDSTPLVKDLPESEANDFIKNRPGSFSQMVPIPTGVKVIEGKDGQPTWETTFTVYKKSDNHNDKQFPVTAAMIKQYKDDGMDVSHPDLFDILKPGRTISGRQLDALTGYDLTLKNQKRQTQLTQSSITRNEALAKEANAKSIEAYAAAQKDKTAIGNLSDKKTEQGLVKTAFDDLHKNGNNMNALDTSGRIIIGNYAKGLIAQYNATARAAMQAGDTDAAKQSIKAAEQWQFTLNSAMNFKPVPPPPTREQQIEAIVQKFSNLNPDEADDRLNNTPNLSPADREEIEQRLQQGRTQRATQTRQNIKNAGKAAVSMLPALIP